MPDPKPRKPVKVGVHQDGGPPPGYQWNIDILDIAYEESAAILNEEQRDFVAEQFRELATHDDPTHSQTIDIRAIEDYFEFRDKGGLLGKLNIRIFFWVDKKSRTIAILSTFNKKNDGPTPEHIKIRVRHRKRIYIEIYSSGSQDANQ